jgi:NAD-dependent deacetylase
MKKLVVLTGAGISAESGIPTFRGTDGLWEGHRVEDVASPEGWRRDQQMVLDFYNLRRKAVIEAEPNKGHHILAELQEFFDVMIITQNIDNLHERAGSRNVLHLHGEILKARSTRDPNLVYDMKGWELKPGDKCEKGSQLRPHIVWFGEADPMIEPAAEICMEADYFVVVGTSLLVYPAAGLVNFTRPGVPKYIVDPNMPNLEESTEIHRIEAIGSVGLEKVRTALLAN